MALTSSVMCCIVLWSQSNGVCRIDYSINYAFDYFPCMWQHWQFPRISLICVGWSSVCRRWRIDLSRRCRYCWESESLGFERVTWYRNWWAAMPLHDACRNEWNVGTESTKTAMGESIACQKNSSANKQKIGFTASSTTMMMKKSMNSCIVQFAWNSA